MGVYKMNAENMQVLKPEQGMFELSLMNAEASSAQFDDVAVEALNRGLPPELVTRFKEMWEQTKVIAGEIVAIGKIIVRQIIEFLRQNPKLTVGMALGAAVAALIGGIPVIGPLLLPLAALIATLYGAGVGAAMEKGDNSGSPLSAAIALAEAFFELLKNILNSVANYLSPA
jgi:hypothetical protein